MKPKITRVIAACLLLSAGTASMGSTARLAWARSPYEGIQRWGPGGACAFPVEMQAASKIKVRLLGASRVITSSGAAATTVFNLNDPSKSITIRGSGTWQDSVRPDGSTRGHMSGHSFVTGGAYQLSLFTGDWTVLIRADGQSFDPPVGKGHQINLCDVLA